MNRNTSRTRHIAARYFHLAQFVDDGAIILKHKASESMIADLLTKISSYAMFKSMRNIIMNEENLQGEGHNHASSQGTVLGLEGV